MAKLTDPEVIQALYEGKKISRDTEWCISYNSEPLIFCSQAKSRKGFFGEKFIYHITLLDLEVDDWQIVQD